MNVLERTSGGDVVAEWNGGLYSRKQLKARGLTIKPDATHADKIICHHCNSEAFDWINRSDYPQDLALLSWLHDKDCRKHALRQPVGMKALNIHNTLKQDGSQIRVLQLHARATSPYIQCSLRTVERTAKPDYHALSYTWGTMIGIRPYFILLNDCPWRVTPNLFYALKGLQYEHDARNLWVDALCINQSDDEEKTQQVNLMADIYRNSAETQIWLNETSTSVSASSEAQHVKFNGDTSDVAVVDRFLRQHVAFDNDADGGDEALNHVGGNCGCCRGQTIFASLRDEHYLGAVCLLLQLAENKHLHQLPFLRTGNQTLRYCSMWPKILLAVNAIVLTPWFERIWIVQEAVLSPKSVVHFRSLQFPFSILLKAQVNSDKHKKNCCSGVYLSMPFMQQNIFRMLNEKMFYLKSDVSTNCSSLTRAVWRFMGREATDPRDKIFGVLSLMCDEYRDCIGDLLPNYSFNLSQTYLVAALLMVDESWDERSLRMLTLVRKDSCERLGLPSWVPVRWQVPDWSNYDPYLAPRLVWSRSYCAAGDIIFKPKAHNKFLALGNLGVDEVSTVCRMVENFNHGRHFLDTIGTWFLDAIETLAALISEQGTVGSIPPEPCHTCGSTSCHNPSVNTLQRAFYRTLLCDLAPPENARGEGTKAPRASEEDIDSLAELFKWGSEQPDFFDLAHVPDHLRPAFNALTLSLFRRRFFTTRLGLFGLGPIEMETGDEVRIILGSDIPMIVRSVHEFFRWTYVSSPNNVSKDKLQDVQSRDVCQDYLRSCARELLRYRPAALQEDMQNYAQFVAAVFTDWRLPAVTDPNAQKVAEHLGQAKMMRMMHLALTSPEISHIVDQLMQEIEQLFGGDMEDQRKVDAKVQEWVQEGQPLPKKETHRDSLTIASWHVTRHTF